MNSMKMEILELHLLGKHGNWNKDISGKCPDTAYLIRWSTGEMMRKRAGYKYVCLCLKNSTFTSTWELFRLWKLVTGELKCMALAAWSNLS